MKTRHEGHALVQVAGCQLSMWRPGFDSRPVHIVCVADQVVLGQVFSVNTSVLLCLRHSTDVPHLFLYHQHSVASVIGSIIN